MVMGGFWRLLGGNRFLRVIVSSYGWLLSGNRLLRVVTSYGLL